MSETIETNRATVVKVDESGVTVAINSENKHMTWDGLRLAARQEDAGLREFYRGILDEAEYMAAIGPVVVTVEQDNTHVWWMVCVRAVYGGGQGHYHRAADEGGTCATHDEAAFHACNIAKRIGNRATLRL